MSADIIARGIGLRARARADAAVSAMPPVVAAIDLTQALPAGAVFTRAGTAGYFAGPGSYQVAPVDAPRIEHAGGNGLLLEPFAANILQLPNVVSDAGWTGGGAAKTTGQPDRYGGTSAVLVSANGTSGSHFLSSTGASDMVAGTTYVLSVEVKPTGAMTRIQLTGGTAAFGLAQYANFSLVGGGKVLATSGTVANAGVEALGDGWYRIWIAVPAIASGTNVGMSIACISGDTAVRLETNSSTDVFLIDFAQVEATTTPASGPTSFVAGGRNTESLTLSVAGLGLADGVATVRYVFSDATTQDVQKTVARQAFSVPTNLSRRRIARIVVLGGSALRGLIANDPVPGSSVTTGTIIDATTMPNWCGRIAQPRYGSTTAALATDTGKLIGLSYIGQSLAVPSGTGNATIFPALLFPYHVLKFNAGRYANGDPVQGGGKIDQATLGDISPSDDDATFAGYPMNATAYIAQYWARYRGERASPYLVRTDALGGIPITYLRKGADAGGSPKYFYVNAQATRKAMLAQAQAFGLDLDYRIVMVQGEDPSVATDLYQTYLSTDVIDAHLADSVTDIGRRPTSFIILQSNGLTDGSNDQRPGPLAHIAETRRRRGTVVALAGPMYNFPGSADTIHYDMTGRLMAGDLVNYVQREIARAGSFTPLDLVRKATPGLAANQGLRGPNLAAGTKITALGTGAGGIGTYTVNNSQAVASQKFVAFGAVFVGSIAGTTLTVTAIIEGALDVTIAGSTVAVRFNRPVRIDTDWVPDVGPALGFSWSDTGGSRTIGSVAVDRDLVTLTLSGAPSGAMSLGYAIDNVAAPYLHTGGVSGSNWAAPRGLIYADSGVEAAAYVLGGYGTPTVRLYAVRLAETF